jgi:hypothetical protein
MVGEEALAGTVMQLIGAVKQSAAGVQTGGDLLCPTFDSARCLPSRDLTVILRLRAV